MDITLRANEIPEELREFFEMVDGRDLTDTWIINPGSYAGAHFAPFPEKLVEPMVKAATSAHGCCPNCLAPHQRVVVKESHYGRRQDRDQGEAMPQVDSSEWRPPTYLDMYWQPTCTCNAGEPVPCTILDPFAGSGTTLRVALRLGRHAIGVDISDVYLKEHVEDRVSNLQFEMAF